ncbi:FadR/GntR family transcriptional regulator [Corallococcus exercitus]|uniref:FadR/GntR family transcriptional regulator n=1 Tax=Corallococcus exercitus TaxID=2316736 RepID=UPI003462E53E
MAYVEEQLERDISLGRLPRNGQLASERMMARWYGVSRGTVREALRRLAARGLVVQRSGSQTRALALGDSLTLENLSLALHDERSQECRRLLDGFFSLKRQVLVELLADCCAKASLIELRLLTDICFQLWDAARWHPGERCAQLEFELLRQAAQVAGRPGHLLLIQSLQRAFRGNAARLLTFMGGESLREWAICANHALDERDMQTLQQQLPVLLKACDELVLNRFAPVPQEAVPVEVHLAQECSLNAPASASSQDDALEALPCVEERGLGCPPSTAEKGDALEALPCVEERGLGCPPSTAEKGDALEALPCVETHELGTPVSNTMQDDAPEAIPCVDESRGLGDLVAATAQADAREARSCVESCCLGDLVAATAQDDAREARSCVEVRGLGRIAPAPEEIEPLGVSHGPQGRALPRESDSEVLRCPSTAGGVSCEPGGAGAGRDVPSPDGGLPFEAPPTGSRGQSRGAVCKEGGPLHCARSPLGRWAVRLWCFIAQALGLPAS